MRLRRLVASRSHGARARSQAKLEFLESSKWLYVLPSLPSPPTVIFWGDNQGPTPRKTWLCPAPTSKAPKTPESTLTSWGEWEGQPVGKGLPLLPNAGWGWVSASWAAVTKCHKPGGLKEEMYHLTVHEAQSPRSRCRQGYLSLKSLGETPSLLFRFLVAAAATGDAWPAEKLQDDACTAFQCPLYLSPESPPLVRTLVILDVGPTLIQYDLTLI